MNENNDRNYILSQDDEHRIVVLSKAADNCLKDIMIYRDGVKDEKEALDQIFEYQSQLHEAVNFLRSGESIVSMQEYRKMMSEIKSIHSVINAKKVAIQNLEGIILEKIADLKYSQEMIEKIRKLNRLGVILAFKPKK